MNEPRASQVKKSGSALPAILVPALHIAEQPLDGRSPSGVEHSFGALDEGTAGSSQLYPKIIDSIYCTYPVF